MYVPLLPVGSNISGHIPELYTWLYHICDKHCVTVLSHCCGRRYGRRWSQPHSPPGTGYGHHIGGPQKRFLKEESPVGCSDDADEDNY